MNASSDQTPAPATAQPAQTPVPATAAPQTPANNPAITAPTAAKGNDDVMSQQEKKS